MAKIQRIMVVDESAGLCEGLDLLLTSYGHSVQTCRDVREARKLIETVPADGYLIQTTPPGKDVVEFIKLIRKAGPAVVLQCGPELPEDKRQDLITISGADGWVSKPIEAMAVLKQMRAVDLSA